MTFLRLLDSGGTVRTQPNLFRTFVVHFDPFIMVLTFFRVASTLRSLHWALYGYVQPVDLHILPGQIGPELQRNDHWITQLSGEALVAVYHVVIVLTILKLIVSLMVRTADQVLVSSIVALRTIPVTGGT